MGCASVGEMVFRRCRGSIGCRSPRAMRRCVAFVREAAPSAVATFIGEQGQLMDAACGDRWRAGARGAGAGRRPAAAAGNTFTATICCTILRLSRALLFYSRSRSRAGAGAHSGKEVESLPAAQAAGAMGARVARRVRAAQHDGGKPVRAGHRPHELDTAQTSSTSSPTFEADGFEVYSVQRIAASRRHHGESTSPALPDANERGQPGRYFRAGRAADGVRNGAQYGTRTPYIAPRCSSLVESRRRRTPRACATVGEGDAHNRDLPCLVPAREADLAVADSIPVSAWDSFATPSTPKSPFAQRSSVG